MIKKSLVSILIINYNNEKYLDRAIKSCINQTYKNLEILIYDDKSTDGSKFLLNKYSKHKLYIWSDLIERFSQFADSCL